MHNLIPGAGFEPARPFGAQDFKSPDGVPRDNNLDRAPSDDVSQDGAGCRDMSQSTATDPATGRPAHLQRGPLELACRDAGLPPCAESLQRLEDVALQAGLVKAGQTVTPADLRRAARLYRKVMANQKQVVPHFGQGTGDLTKRQARKLLAKEHGLTSGRQWKAWKKAQRRTQRTLQREVH